MPIIIDISTIDPPKIYPGRTATIRIVAHDSRFQELNVSGPGIDSQGNPIPMSVRVTLGLPPDAIPYRARPPTRGTLNPVPGQPGVFIYTADSSEASDGR